MDSYETPSSSVDVFLGVPLCDLDAIEDFWRPRQDDWDPWGFSDQVKLSLYSLNWVLSTDTNALAFSRTPFNLLPDKAVGNTILQSVVALKYGPLVRVISQQIPIGITRLKLGVNIPKLENNAILTEFSF